MTRKNEDAQIIHDIIPLVLHSTSLSIMSLTGAYVDYGLLLNFHAGYGDIIDIPGDIFTIFGKGIINLNVKYIN